LLSGNKTMSEYTKLTNNTKNYLITSPTGLLASHILYQILEDNVDNLQNIRIVNLVHGLTDEKINYTLRKEHLYKKTQKKSFKEIKEILINVNFELTSSDLGLDPVFVEKMKGVKIEHLFHSAAITDFRDKESIKPKLDKINVEGTANVLTLTKIFVVKNFHYVSSAYVCGITSGKIIPDQYTDSNFIDFHNYYEFSKLKAEKLVEDYCVKEKINYMIFRPSTISGRLMYEPIGYINKFDVFYALFRFFYKMRYLYALKENPEIKDKAWSPLNEKKIVPFNIRIQAAENQGLNIVPVDYAAKIIIDVSNNNNFIKKEKIVNIVNNDVIFHRTYINTMMEVLKFKDFEFVNKNIPHKEQTQTEQSYYRMVGDIFHGYLNQGNLVFSVDNLKDDFEDTLKLCPVMSGDNFRTLINYALDNNFTVK